MFRNKKLNLAIPQSEHLRLSGVIALLWGNSVFQKPEIPFQSFLEGIALHDAGYNLADTYTIFDMTKEERKESLEKLINHELNDSISNLIAQHHIKRLLQNSEFDELKQKNSEKISSLLNEVDFDENVFMRIDRITDFCDSVSFDFCVGLETENQIDVYIDNSTDNIKSVKYKFDGQEKITVEPWPLKTDYYEGYIIGYDPKNYPEVLKPKIITYRITKERI